MCGHYGQLHAERQSSSSCVIFQNSEGRLNIFHFLSGHEQVPIWETPSVWPHTYQRERWAICTPSTPPSSVLSNPFWPEKKYVATMSCLIGPPHPILPKRLCNWQLDMPSTELKTTLKQSTFKKYICYVPGEHCISRVTTFRGLGWTPYLSSVAMATAQCPHPTSLCR